MHDLASITVMFPGLRDDLPAELAEVDPRIEDRMRAMMDPSRVGQCGRRRFPSRFHLPYPDRDHTSQSLLAERLSTSTLEPIA
jgi:hypothetical protein